MRVEGVQVDPNADGRYLVTPARPGLSVAINAPGYFEALQLYKGGDLERFALQPRLTGIVTDADSGKPIPGALVYLADDGQLDLARGLLRRALDLDPENHDAALIMSSLPSA